MRKGDAAVAVSCLLLVATIAVAIAVARGATTAAKAAAGTLSARESGRRCER